MSDVLEEPTFPGDEMPAEFPAAARAWIERLFAVRRDVRHFDPSKVVSDDALRRVLASAHLAPSVGFSQPWRFIVLRDIERRARIRESFLACRRAEAARFSPERREQYLSLKLEGITDAPINLCVVADLRPQGEALLGTTVQPESVRASVLCAVQNLWLSARAAGLGVGWVSVVEPQVLRAELGLPSGVEPVAYLCLGVPARPYLKPMLEEVGWKARLPLDAVIHHERFDDSRPADEVPRAPAVALSQALMPQPELLREASERRCWDGLVMPQRASGRLEELATFWATRRAPLEVPVPALTVFAADHGVVVEGVSAYSSVSTLGVLGALMAEQSTTAVLALRFGIPITLCDVGTANDRSRLPRLPRIELSDRRIGPGTQNLRYECAMSQDECGRAMEVGRSVVRELNARGVNLLGLGEVGIGNTTSAAAICAALLGLTGSEVAGRGTGLDPESVSRKAQVIDDALARLGTRRSDPGEVLREVGGFEIAALTGAILEARALGFVIVLDGAVTGAAALVAERMQPGCVTYCLASHASAERCGETLLSSLGLNPLLRLDLCLGEGAGAALGMDLLLSALSVRRAVATFAEAGIVDRARTHEILARPRHD